MSCLTFHTNHDDLRTKKKQEEKNDCLNYYKHLKFLKTKHRKKYYIDYF